MKWIWRMKIQYLNKKLIMKKNKWMLHMEIKVEKAMIKKEMMNIKIKMLIIKNFLRILNVLTVNQLIVFQISMYYGLFLKNSVMFMDMI